jgi:alpha-galactosidase
VQSSTLSTSAEDESLFSASSTELRHWGQDNVWTWDAGMGNSWRTTGDIAANYNSLLNIFHTNVGLASYAGSGRWNDPNMLEIGNGMSATEDRTQFSL